MACCPRMTEQNSFWQSPISNARHISDNHPSEVFEKRERWVRRPPPGFLGRKSHVAIIPPRAPASVDVPADIDPLQSIGRPVSAPAAVVAGVEEGRAKEGKAMEAMMEEAVVERGVREPWRECGVPVGRAGEMAAVEMRSAHPAEMPAAHGHAAARVHPAAASV